MSLGMLLLPLALAAPPAAQLTIAEQIERIPLPPIRFRGDAVARVHFADPSELYALCGRKVEVGKILMGCARHSPPQLFLSNPCLSLEQLWAKEGCHEVGHVNGWTEAHEE